MSYPIKFLLLISIFFSITFGGIFFYLKNNSSLTNRITEIEYIPTNELEISAYSQIGIVTEYDTTNGYYNGGEPPSHMGVCSDVVTRSLKKLGYDLQEKIFEDITNNPKDYNDVPDRNINHRRVKNLLIYFQKYFISLPLEVNNKTMHTWKAGDIITYEKIPGQLWHIGIVSGKKSFSGVPMLIDNHGYGTQVRIAITSWQSDISGHFRIP